jgi:hypothetical protein
MGTIYCTTDLLSTIVDRYPKSFVWIKYYYWVYRKYDMLGISNYILLIGIPSMGFSGWKFQILMKSCWPRLSALLWPVNRFDSLGPDTFEAPPPIATRLASMAPQRRNRSSCKLVNLSWMSRMFLNKWRNCDSITPPICWKQLKSSEEWRDKKNVLLTSLDCLNMAFPW